MAYYGIAKPAVFMFLLASVGVSSAAIASGIAERENRVYDVSAVQEAVRDLAGKTDRALDHQEGLVCELIEDVTSDLENVNDTTDRNRRLIHEIVANGADGNCSRVRRGSSSR